MSEGQRLCGFKSYAPTELSILCLVYIHIEIFVRGMPSLLITASVGDG